MAKTKKKMLREKESMKRSIKENIVLHLVI